MFLITLTTEYRLYSCTNNYVWSLCTYAAILKEHQLSFVKYISLEALIPHLNRQHILTFEEQDKLANQEQEEASRIRELLDIVESKGADCYVKFIRAIFEEKTHDGHMTLSAEVQRSKYASRESIGTAYTHMEL